MIKKIGYSIAFIGLFASFLTILTAWSILTSLNILKNGSISSIPAVLSVELDVSSILGDRLDIENGKLNYPSKRDYEEIAKLEEVKSFDITLLDMYLSPNLSDFSGDKSGFGLFFVRGITESTIFDEKLNNIRLTAGRMISDDEIRNGANCILISEEVAKRNNLQAGSDFILQISNPENPKEIFKQEIQVVGIFNPSGEIGSKNVGSQNLEDSHGHDHNDAEEGNSSEVLKKTETENVISLQNKFLMDSLNTIYMSNNTAKKILKKRDKEFENDLTSLNYTASYILHSPNQVNAFKEKAEKILPEYFTLYGVDEAYDLWLPSTSYLMVIIELIASVMFLLSITILVLIIVVSILKNKNLLIQYLLLGKNYSDFSRKFFTKYGVIVLSVIFPSILVAPVLAKKIISEYIILIESNTGMYFNIQNLTRNLVNTSKKISDYSTFNEYYLIGASITYVSVIIVVLITISIMKKRLLRGILI